MQKDSTNKGVFWSCLGNLAQSFLAHVNITYNGATQSFHIDIVPTECLQEVPEPQAIEAQPKQKLIEQKDKPGSGKRVENQKTVSQQKRQDQKVGGQSAQRQYRMQRAVL